MIENKTDWCGKHKGKYIDLTINSIGTWSFFYDGERIKSGIETKKKAMSELLEFLKKK